MKLEDYKHVDEVAQENEHYSKYQMIMGFGLYLVFDFIPYLISWVPVVILVVMGNVLSDDPLHKFYKFSGY